MTAIFGKQVVDKQSLMDTVIDLIATMLGQKRVKIKPTTPLLSGEKVFDSFGLMEFVLRLEDTFGISIPDEDLDPDIFDSPQTIVGYLRRRLEGGE
jgi:acyl carrier protein